MSTEYWSPPDVDDRDGRDDRILRVLEDLIDDLALLMIAAGPELVPPVTPVGVDLWKTRVYSRARRDLSPEDARQAVVMLLGAQARRRANDLMFTVRGVDPDDLVDGPWST